MSGDEAVSAAPFGLLEHVPVPVFVFEVVADDFILSFVNASARATNPYITRFLGQPMGALYRDQPNIEADARRALHEGVPIVSEVVVRRHDQTEAVMPLRLTWVPLPPSHLAVFTQAKVEAGVPDAALRESEARYRGLFESLPDAVLLRSADGRVLACNDAAARLWGATDSVQLVGRQQVLGDHLRVRDESGSPVTEKDLPSLVALRTGKPAGPTIYEVLAKSGTARWLRAAAQPIFASSGAVSASVTVLTDITERVDAEHRLRSAAARLDLALNAGQMGVWEYDATTNAGWWSENLNKIFAILSDRPPGIEAFSTLVHPDDVVGFLDSVREFVQRADDRGFEAVFRIVGDDKVARYARIQGRRIVEPLRFVGTITDITEQRRLEDELRRAHRLESIGLLAGGVAHDFNNLLGAMLGAVEMLDADDRGRPNPDIETIRHAVMRARDLTRQLLAFARKQPIEFRPVHLGDLVTAVERMLRRLVGPNIEIELAVERAVVVRADAASLEQVLVNLVINARDAMPGGGRLTVRVGTTTSRDAASARRAVIEVTDSGAGMDESTRGRVFDPFFTTKEHGTGLGLASSYGIVQQHGGDIAVESQLGRGTTFRVSLPAIDAPHELPVEPKHRVHSAEPVRAGMALVVDDEDLVRTTAERLLRSLGYEVLAASTAAHALELSKAHLGPIDVMLCDVAMPVRDGPSLALEMLCLRPELRVVLASGYTENVLPESLERSVFLAKPYTRSELAAKLKDVRGR